MQLTALCAAANAEDVRTHGLTLIRILQLRTAGRHNFSSGATGYSLEDTPVANEFPAIWFDTFMQPEHVAPVDRELTFIQESTPVSAFPRLLDVPCGIGRHAGPLAGMGYEVLGVDRSDIALKRARESFPGVQFRKLDMFALGCLTTTFDTVICLWQSFGYGDSEQNREMLETIQKLVRPGGRILLDIYNADAVRRLPPVTVEKRGDRIVRTRRWLQGKRLRVALEYSDADDIDWHEWEIYTPAEITQLAADVDLRVLVSCAWFDPSIQPSSEHLRMQLLMERRH